MWFKRWRKAASDTARQGRSAARPVTFFRPQVEILEDRITPTAAFSTVQTLVPNLSNPTGLSGLVSGDFTGDGRIDLLTASSTSAQLSLFPGVGDGTFGNPVLTNLPAAPVALAAGHFNNDNIQDVAVATASGQILIFFGTTSGTFQAGPTIDTGGPISALATGLDQNGFSDVVALNPNASTLTVYLNSGSGFTSATPVNVTSMPTSVAVGDFDNDGLLDAVVGSSSNDTLTLLRANGSGTFTATPLALPAGATATGLALVTSGPTPELAVSDGAGSSLLLYTNNGGGSFTLEQTVSGIANPTQIAAADFDGDGTIDFAVANGSSNSVTLVPSILGNTPPLGTPQVIFTTGANANFLVAADFNDDGKVDLVSGTSSGSNPTLTVAQNQSTATDYFATASDRGSQPVITIYNAQGQLLYSFDPLAGASFTGGLRVAIGNVVGTATPDLIVGTGPGGVTLVQIYDGDSILAGKPTLVTAFNPYGPAFGGGVFVATGNLNGSNFDQIITGADAGGGAEVSIWSIVPNISLTNPGYDAITDGDPLFVYPLGSFTGGVRVAAADVNGDGLDDIITGAGPGGGPEVKIYLGSKNGFYDPTPFASFFGITPNSFTGGIFVTAGDFDGDYKAEVIVAADQGGGPQVQVFDGAAIVANPANVVSVGGFNALLPPTFTGGTRIGTTIGQFQSLIGRVLVSTAGPGGNQLTVFDISAFLTNPTEQPPEFLAVFTPPLGVTVGQYVS